MTKEELLKPRYRVLVKYPNSQFEKGDVLGLFIDNRSEIRTWYLAKTKDSSVYLVGHPESCPEVFKALAWWEEREERDMPKCVKHDNGCIHINLGIDINQHMMRVKEGCEGLSYLWQLTPSSEEEMLEDVLKNLFSEKYSKKEIIYALAYGERNTQIYHPLMKKYQPKYYCEGYDNPIQGMTLVIDLGLNATA